MILCYLNFPNPIGHTIQVKLVFPSLPKGRQDFVLPFWRPGRYEQADFCKNITGFQAFDQNGHKINYRKTAVNIWSVDNEEDRDVTIHFEYFAHKMDAGNSWIDEDLIYVNFINCIFYHLESVDQPHQVHLQIPENYQLACGLGSEAMLMANDYYQLVDSPAIASSRIQRFDYEVLGTSFQIVFEGDNPLDPQQMIHDFERFTRKQIDRMGSFPSNRYQFLVHALPYRHYHGVEHQQSTVLTLGPNTSENSIPFREMLLGVSSHELFHAWNVCQIRPAELSPYDFRKEILFETGFVAEGFTTYFGDLFLVSSGVISRDEYYQEVNTLLKRHFQNYGRFESSLLESSRNLWVDGYQNHPAMKKVSIYVKGALISLVLDIQIRKTSKNNSSLLDVIKHLYLHHTYEQGGYQLQDVYDLFEKIAGKKIAALAQRLVEQTEPLENILDETLDHVGCVLEKRNHPVQLTSELGFTLVDGKISGIAPRSIGSRLFSIGDHILEVNGRNYEAETIYDSFNHLLVERKGQKIPFELPEMTGEYYTYFTIVNQDQPSEEQVNCRNVWLG